MGKRAREPTAGAGKRRRHEGGEHQRHRAKLAGILSVPGASGVFMSCARGKERKAAMELVDLLDEHSAALYPNAADVDADDMDALRNGPAPATLAPSATSRLPTDDIEAQIRGELATLQSRPQRTTSQFAALDTDTECLCFVQCAPPLDAWRIVRRALEEVERTGASRSRFVQRLIPVRVLCRAETEAIRAATARALAPAFPAKHARTYRIEPRIRANSSLSRDVLIPLVASCVPPGATVDLKQPEVTIVVEVLRNICGIGAVEDYERFGKLNVQTLADRQRSKSGDGPFGRVAAGRATEAAAEAIQSFAEPTSSTAETAD